METSFQQHKTPKQFNFYHNTSCSVQ